MLILVQPAWSQIEEKVKENLEKEYDKKFLKKRITIGNYEREIDLLSDDEEIAVQIKSTRGTQAMTF